MKFKTKEMVLIALFTAIFSVIGPLSVPIGPVPVSLTNFIIYISAYILTSWQLASSIIIYIALGAAGLPVFSGYGGGLAKLAGPTGGYITGFIFTAIISGTAISRFHNNRLISCLGMFFGLIITYVFGTLWFAFLNGDKGLYYILITCVVPFIPFDIGKIIIASLLGPAVSKRLKH